MASYHLNIKIIKRSSGRSAVAAAAYRARTSIYDERQGLTFDYSKKLDLAHSEILAPQIAPKWVYDRSALWNQVEASEKRKDAQLSREIEIALPIELNIEEQKQLVRDYVNANFINEGMIADINIHASDTNPHAHIMLTTREITADGFGKKNRHWNKKAFTMKWREEWANLQNIYIAKAGFDIRVDHRSYQAQGVSVDPQIKMGPISYKDKDSDYERAEEFKRIAFKNGKLIIESPEIALEHITKYQSTFTHDDILKYLHSHTDESQFYNALNVLTSSPDLVLIEENEYDRYNKYTTRSLMKIENQLISDAVTLSQLQTHLVNPKYIEQAAKTCNLSDEQKGVLLKTVNGSDIHAIIGHAGTGKSYTLNAVREAYEANGYSLQGCSLSGVAAEGLEQSSGIKSSTIHRKLYDWENGRNQLHSKSVLVIDEAGMVGTRQMQTILDQVKIVGAKIIVVGDTKQTQAVEAGGAFRGIIEHVETSRLKEVWRQNDEWQKEATRLLSGSNDDVSLGIDAFNEHGRVLGYDDYNQAASAMLSDYVRNYSDDKTSLMIGHTNDEIQKINLVCRHELKKRTEFITGKEYKIHTTTGEKYFSMGDRVLFLRNEKSLNVKNGTFGTIRKINKPGVMLVDLGDKRSVVVDTNHYNSITHGYAATVHKTQGATIDNTYVLASKGFDRHLGYVALSRHRENVGLYYSQDVFQNYEHLKRNFSNLGEKELLADYDQIVDPVDRAIDSLTAMNATVKASDFKSVSDRLDENSKSRFWARIEALGKDAYGNTIYSTADMVSHEATLFKASKSLGQRSSHVLDKETIKETIGRRKLADNQRSVINRVAWGTDLTLVHYLYGSDRKYVAGLIGQAYQKSGYMVEGVALSGMGAKSLADESGLASTTVYQRLWEWENGRNELTAKSVVIIDNANLVGTRQLGKILEHAEKANAKVIAFGDVQALQAIEAGGAYRGILEKSEASVVSLSPPGKKIGWQAHAQQLFRGDERDAVAAINAYAEHGYIEKASRPLDCVVSDWLGHVRSSDPARPASYKNNLMMAYSNADVQALNLAARDRLKKLGYVDATRESIIKTYDKGALAVAGGERLMFLRKDNDIGVTSGTLGTVRSVDGDRLTVKIDEGATVSVNTRLYNDLNHGYAATVYRSSGMSVENTCILATRHYNKHAISAALAVHSKSAKIYHGFANYHEFQKIMSRAADKDLTADYPMEKAAYKITVQLPGRSPNFKYITIDPQVNAANIKRALERSAREFVYERSTRAGLKPEQISQVKTKVEKISIEQYQGHQKTKEKPMGKGRSL